MIPMFSSDDLALLHSIGEALLYKSAGKNRAGVEEQQKKKTGGRGRE